MTETVAIRELTKQELEPALRRLLGHRAFFAGLTGSNTHKVVQAGTTKVEFIDDDLENRRIIAFTRIPDVLSMEVVRKGAAYQIVRPTEPMEATMDARYRGLIARHETAVLRQSFPQLVRIADVDMAMRPLSEILIRVQEYGQYIPRARRGTAPGRRQAREAKYARFLADINFIRREGAGYVAGPELPSGFGEDAPAEEIYQAFLGGVLQANHQYLTDVLHLTMITPFLRVENAYYWPAHRAERMIRIRRERFEAVHRHYYGRTSAHFESNLQSLIRKGALEREKGNIVGTDEILGPLLKADGGSWATSGAAT